MLHYQIEKNINSKNGKEKGEILGKLIKLLILNDLLSSWTGFFGLSVSLRVRDAILEEESCQLEQLFHLKHGACVVFTALEAGHCPDQFPGCVLWAGGALGLSPCVTPSPPHHPHPLYLCWCWDTWTELCTDQNTAAPELYSAAKPLVVFILGTPLLMPGILLAAHFWLGFR